jgi:hypothetical protein
MKIFLILVCFLIINIAFGQSSNNNKQSKTSLKNTSGFSLNTPSCDELVHYRDVDLVIQFDNVTKKYSDKYKLDNEAIEDMKKQKSDLLNERGWDELMSTGTAMSDGGVTTAQIANRIKTNCDLILGIGEIFLEENPASAGTKAVILTAKQTYDLINAGKDLKEIVEGNLEKVAAQKILDQMDIGGKITKTALDFAKNLDERVKIPEEREKLKSEVERILDMQDNAISKYQKDLENNKELLNQKIQIVNGITKYLVEHHCKASPKEETKNLEKKELDKNKNTRVIANDKKANGKHFYFGYNSVFPNPTQWNAYR